MRTIVTGGAGFIGTHLIEALVERGDSVVCVEHPRADLQMLRKMNVETHACGVHDIAALSRVLDGADAVIHLAGLTEARRASDFYQVNTLGTEGVLKAAAAFGSSAPHVILLSSIAAVGPNRNGEPITHESAAFPLSHYGQSKLLAECLVHAYGDRVPASIVRLAAVYGPRERNILHFFRLISHGVGVTIGGWDRELSMIFVRDAVDGLLAITHRSVESVATFCLAHPEAVSWRRFAEVSGRSFDRSPILFSLPQSIATVAACVLEASAAASRRSVIFSREKLREIVQKRWVCDVSPMLGELGYQPAWPIDRGIPETINWYREKKWL